MITAVLFLSSSFTFEVQQVYTNPPRRERKQAWFWSAFKFDAGVKGCHKLKVMCGYLG